VVVSELIAPAVAARPVTLLAPPASALMYPLGMVITMVPPLLMSVAVLKATETVAEAVAGTNELGVKVLNNVIVPPSAFAVWGLLAVSIATPAAVPVLTVKPLQRDVDSMGEPRVRPPIVTVNVPAVTAALVVMTTDVCCVAAIVPAKPVDAVNCCVGVPVK